MIGKLQGIVDFIGDDYIILNVVGVGYKVFVPNIQSIIHDSKINLWIETIVREDSIRLFGFETISGQELFNKLLGVSGVGPKVALNILGAFKESVLMNAILTGDVKTITAAPGVGKKVAEKIIVELKGKVSGMGGIVLDNENNALSDLLSALETLGYRRIDVAEIASKLTRDNPTAGIEILVPMALKEVSKK